MPNFSSLAGLEVARLIRLGLLGKADTSLAALGHSLTACKIQNGRNGAPKWPMGSGKVPTSRFLGGPVKFCSISFLIRALLLREK